MADYGGIMEAVKKLHDTHKPIDMCPPVPDFPLPQMYVGQRDTIEKMRKVQSFVLSSHTGSGKTPVFLTLTRYQPTIIIEPRKFLQKQVQKYCNDFVLFGRREYPCEYAIHAGIAPCLQKTSCIKTYYKDDCENFTTPHCVQSPCRVFLADSTFHIYPCSDCAYIAATINAVRILRGGGTVICNFGNFWNLLQHATNVVIDEADLFFKEISSPKILYTAADVTDIKTMLETEIADLLVQLQESGSTNSYRIQNAIYSLQFFHQNADLCFAYIKTDRKTKKNRVYVEINPANTNVLKDKIFVGKRLIIVTATPGEFSLPVASYEIWQRCGIYFTPVGKLTSRELLMRPFLLEHAATFIETMSSIFEGTYESKKFVVHCGNIGNHATKMFDLLGDKEEHDRYGNPKNPRVNSMCVLHSSGNLMGTIDRFVESNKRYLLVASAEYGADFTWCNCQFILKFPYASYDDRMKALERSLGKEKFKQLYVMDAVSRFIQQCGRVGRGYDSFGATFVIDGKALEVFRDLRKRVPDAFPDWFQNRAYPDIL